MSQITHILSREELKVIPQEVIRRYYQEYMRRWKVKNRDKVNAYARERYKRIKGNTNTNSSRFTKNDNQDNGNTDNTNKGNTKINNIFNLKGGVKQC